MTSIMYQFTHIYTYLAGKFGNDTMDVTTVAILVGFDYFWVSSPTTSQVTTLLLTTRAGL